MKIFHGKESLYENRSFGVFIVPRTEHAKYLQTSRLRSHESPYSKVTAGRMFVSICKTRNCDLPRNSRVQNKFLS